MTNPRETFGSRFAVIMAMAGSAIGLGNIWRFPYLVGEYGGAAFIIVYILAGLILALPIFFAETIIGRRSRQNTVGSMKLLAPDTGWKWLGLLTVFSPVVILSYYSVVGGWSVEYLFKSLTFGFSGLGSSEVTGFFSEFTLSTWAPLVAHSIFLLMSAGIVLAGVKKGIEWFSKLMMPVLFVLIVAVVVYSLTLPGSEKGVEYLIKLDFSKLGAEGILAALGQSFFSLSLGVGAMLIYASYMKKDESILASGIGTVASDTIFAILAGFAVMPAVFSAGLAPSGGPGLVFQTLPYVFNEMGGGVPWIGSAIAILFFLAILVAALTSTISITEVVVAYLSEEKGMSRFKAVAAITLFAWAVGILCSLSFGPLSDVKIFGNTIFDALDKLCGNFLMPFGGLLFTLFVGWKMPSADAREEFTNGGTLSFAGRVYPLVRFLIRYVAPVGIIVIFICGLLG